MDRAGNKDQTPASFTFVVDANAPTVAVLGHKLGPDSMAASFAASKYGCTYTCALSAPPLMTQIASDPPLHLHHAPYALYGVEYIGLVPHTPFVSDGADDADGQLFIT